MNLSLFHDVNLITTKERKFRRKSKKCPKNIEERKDNDSDSLLEGKLGGRWFKIVLK